MNRPEQKYALIRKKKGKRPTERLRRALCFLGVLYGMARESRGSRGSGASRAPSEPPSQPRSQRTVTSLCERLRFSPSLILRTPSTKLPIRAAAYRAKRPREMSRSDETRVKDAAFGGPSGARVVVGYGTLTVPRGTP